MMREPPRASRARACELRVRAGGAKETHLSEGVSRAFVGPVIVNRHFLV